MPLLVSVYLSVISRVLLSSHAVFREMLSILSQKYNKNEQSVLGTLLSYWLMRMRNVSNMEQRKLLGDRNLIINMDPNFTQLII